MYTIIVTYKNGDSCAFTTEDQTRFADALKEAQSDKTIISIDVGTAA